MDSPNIIISGCRLTRATRQIEYLFVLVLAPNPFSDCYERALLCVLFASQRLSD